MYVEDVKDEKGTYTPIFDQNFLNIQPIFNPQKVLESWHLGLSNHKMLYVSKHVKDVKHQIIFNIFDILQHT